MTLSPLILAAAVLAVLVWLGRRAPKAREVPIADVSDYIRIVTASLASPSITTKFTPESIESCRQGYAEFLMASDAEVSGGLVRPDAEAWALYLAGERHARFIEMIPEFEQREREMSARRKAAGIRESRAFYDFRITAAFDRQLPTLSPTAARTLKSVSGRSIDTRTAATLDAVDLIPLSPSEVACIIRLDPHPDTFVGVLNSIRATGLGPPLDNHEVIPR